MESFIGKFGYFALLAGAFLEGEATIALGGVAAQRGLLDFLGVVLVAFSGTFCADQVSFYLGRRHSHVFLSKLPRYPLWQGRVDEVQKLVKRYHITLIFGFRILYGLRTVTPFVFGMSRLSVGYFFALSMISALVWAGVVASAGYLFGNAVEIFLGEIKTFAQKGIVITAVLAGLLWVIYRYRSRRNKRR